MNDTIDSKIKIAGNSDNRTPILVKLHNGWIPEACIIAGGFMFTNDKFVGARFIAFGIASGIIRFLSRL